MQLDIHPSERVKIKRKPKSLDEVFKTINREHVKIKKKARKSNNEILYSVLEELLKIMQTQNKLFQSMKPKLEYLGSYYDGLRVGEPTEYDINVVLKLPVNYKNIYLSAKDTSYDCTNICMPSEFRRLSSVPATVNEGFKETSMWCDGRYRLSVKKFRSWMQKVVDTAMKELPLLNNRRVLCVNNRCYQISTKMSGPANTITIVTGSRDNSVIDVDLVPTFSFELPKKPYESKIVFEKVENCKPVKKEYFAVPKPSDDDFSWRLAFPTHERNCLKNKHNLKSSAKLLKLLRDAQGFKPLASYYIKTLYLWEVASKHKNHDFWKRNTLSYLVLYMLGKLRDCLAKGEIKNFWCPDSNLIKDKIHPETCLNWSNRLSVIMRDIEQKGKSNPDIVKKYFTKKSLAP